MAKKNVSDARRGRKNVKFAAAHQNMTRTDWAKSKKEAKRSLKN